MTGPKPSTPRLPAPDRRRQLIESALDLFSKKGFSGTTTKEIAADLRREEDASPANANAVPNLLENVRIMGGGLPVVPPAIAPAAPAGPQPAPGVPAPGKPAEDKEKDKEKDKKSGD